jgi:hypothetical protein
VCCRLPPFGCRGWIPAGGLATFLLALGGAKRGLGAEAPCWLDPAFAVNCQHEAEAPRPRFAAWILRAFAPPRDPLPRDSSEAGPRVPSRPRRGHLQRTRGLPPLTILLSRLDTCRGLGELPACPRWSETRSGGGGALLAGSCLCRELPTRSRSPQTSFRGLDSSRLRASA